FYKLLCTAVINLLYVFYLIEAAKKDFFLFAIITVYRRKGVARWTNGIQEIYIFILVGSHIDIYLHIGVLAAFYFIIKQFFFLLIATGKNKGKPDQGVK